MLQHLKNFRIIFDTSLRLGNFELKDISYDYQIDKEELSRKLLFQNTNKGLNFLDVGANDGKLDYLLGIRSNLSFDQDFYAENRRKFDQQFNYHGMDLQADPNSKSVVLHGDICSPSYLSDNATYTEFFDFIYSNNVFEHLRKPWIAADNLFNMLKKGGICVTIVPFSQRYHEAPADYFRYTHEGIRSLFEDLGPIEIITSGYDIRGRRNNWQGNGKHEDIVPLDNFGAWRETWFTVFIFRKI